ncbi:MAG: ABC transporter ATPase [Bacteroidetes bacterium]|nr:ABC transporter ATPase [Bacteroidota bacterium]
MEFFTTLPPSARVWIYQADRAFTTAEATQMADDITAFVSQWLAHKAKVIGDGALLYDRFVILAADEEKLAVSGCSIDSTVRFIKDLGAKYGVNFFDRFYTCYLENGKVKGADFDTFKKLMADGEVNERTVVFNNLVNTIGTMQTQWQVPLSDSWQSRVAVPDTALKL